MEKITNPGRYNMELCPVCEGKGKLTGRPGGFLLFVQNVVALGLLKRKKKYLRGEKIRKILVSLKS